jgi:hypothetical protein
VLTEIYSKALYNINTQRDDFIQTTWYSLLLLGYKPVQHVTVLNTVGNCNTVASITILYYNLMGPLSYMRCVVDRNVTMERPTVYVSHGCQ